MKKVKLIMLALVAGAFTLTGCKKYENGGSLKKAEKNLANDWTFDSYYLDGVDRTTTMTVSNFSEKFNSDGTMNRSYTDESGDPISQDGTWMMDDDKTKISVSGVGSIELTEETGTVSASEYIILKLTEDELWYHYENGGYDHEFHLVPN